MGGQEPSMLSKCVAEFVGTFMLVFCVGCNVLQGNANWGAFSIACVLMVMIYAFGSVSGAHFNPAVSVTLGLINSMGSDGMEWLSVGIYCLVQVIAGVAAGFSYCSLFGNTFNLQPAKGIDGWWKAGIAEIIYSFMLCFVVLNVAKAKRNSNNKFYGLAIGWVIVAGVYGAGAISGGCFNPAVAIGIDTASWYLGFGWCGFYTLCELIGACLAAGFFYLVRPEDFGKEEGTLAAALTSEFLGTYMLVLTIGLNICANSPAAAFSIASSLMCMIYALGDVSGAHFNPAVTVATVLAGVDGAPGLGRACAYICTQIVGGILGSLTYYGIACSFGFGPVAPHGWAQVAIAEILFTMVLCLVVLTVACSKTGNDQFFGLAIGSCITAGGFAVGGFSGCSLNPAVSFALALVGVFSGGRFWEALVYAGFEIAGALLAAGIFRVTHIAEFGDDNAEETRKLGDGNAEEARKLVDNNI